MTDKCKRMMNGREEYITTEITQRKGGGGEEKEEEGLEKGERLLGCERSWEFSSSGEGSFLLGTLGRLIVCIFSPPKQVVASSKPNFWTHTLQIHYNGSVGPRSHPLLGPVRKPRPYNWHRLWEGLLVR